MFSSLKNISSVLKMKAISVSRLRLQDSPRLFSLSSKGMAFDLKVRDREVGRGDISVMHALLLRQLAAVCSPSGEANIKEA